MSESIRPYDALIVGAGISGLFAARHLIDHRWSVLIVEKGRGIGGRLATRRIDDAVIDHGAQYFTASDPRFLAKLQPLIDRGLVNPWLLPDFAWPNWAKLDPPQSAYRGTVSLNAVAKGWAEGLPVQRSCLVTQIARQMWSDEQLIWAIQTEGQDVYHARRILLTQPVPQALELMNVSQISVDDELRDRLASITYSPIFTALAVLDRPSALDAPGVMIPDEGPVSWIADNSLKGISPQSALTIQGSRELSIHHFDDSKEHVGELMLNCEAVRDALGVAKIIEHQIHRWRYAYVHRDWHGPSFVAIDSEASLVLAGDSFVGSKVERASLSGLDAAEAWTRSHSPQ